MNTSQFYFAGSTGALDFCKRYLRSKQCCICQQPTDAVTHLVLPAPAFDSDGTVKGGGDLEVVLQQLPAGITVAGGNLSHPALQSYKTVDLLQDPEYLAENAAITAHCAVKCAMNRMNTTFQDCPVLVVGWGRIGKHLARLLTAMGARVRVSARKESDRALLASLGYGTADITPPAYDLMGSRVIFNTVPTMVLPEQLLENAPADCLKIDLASNPGMGGRDIIWARGLPNRDAPEASGILMGKTLLRLLSKEEASL